MNALAAIAAPTPAFEAWLSTGHELLTERTRVEWQLADWIADGREKFGDQAAFDFLADELGIAPKRLKSAAKVARAFPPATRDQTLTFEHHEAVAILPANEALTLLRDAKTAKWDDRETRVAAVKRQASLSPNERWTDDDWHQHQLVTIQRAWNAAAPSVRQEFLDLVEQNNGGPIDA